MKIKYLIITLLVSMASSHGQISGGLDLAPKSQASAESQSSALKEIAVTSFGATPEGAEKRAISDAVRQAVGAYVDAKTITENDAVIKDRILSVSSGFVKKYKVTSPAQKTDDGLYQISITAVVETNQVAAALKDAKIISGKMDGKSLWAESSSKSLNAEDARKMLEEKLPEIYKSLLKIQLINNDGTPCVNTAPLSRVENPSENSVTLSWLIEISTDQEYYRSSALPLIEKCIEAIASTPVKPFKLIAGYYTPAPGSAKLTEFDIESLNKKFTAEEKILIIKNYSRSLNVIEGVYFEQPIRSFGIIFGNSNRIASPVFVDLKLTSSQGELITSKQCDIFGGNVLCSAAPFFRAKNFGSTSIASPFISIEGFYGRWRPSKSLRYAASINVPVSDIKDVSKVEFNLSVAEFKVAILDGGAATRSGVRVPKW